MKKTIAILLVALVGMAGVFAATNQTGAGTTGDPVKSQVVVKLTIPAITPLVGWFKETPSTTNWDSAAATSFNYSDLSDGALYLGVKTNTTGLTVKVRATGMLLDGATKRDDNQIVDLTIQNTSGSKTYSAETADSAEYLTLTTVPSTTTGVRVDSYPMTVSLETDYANNHTAGSYTAKIYVEVTNPS